MKNLTMNSRMIAAVAGAMAACSAMAQDRNIQVVVDGSPIQFTNTSPREERGRVLVPLRGVFEQMGARIRWNPESRMVRATRGGTNVNLVIGARYATINGDNVPLDVPAVIRDGVTMVPLRFVSESMGANVEWLADTHTVDINSGVTSSYRYRPRTQTVETRPEPARDEIRQPLVNWPKEDTQITSPLIVRGIAAANSTVQIHIAYSALTTLNQIRMHGTLGDYSATADRNGHFRSQPIDLVHAHGANVRFVITVYAVDPNGEKTPSTTINVFK